MKRLRIHRPALLVLFLAVTLVAAYEREHNGFDLAGGLVPAEEIHLAGLAEGAPGHRGLYRWTPNLR
jgi:hypothetical protein